MRKVLLVLFSMTMLVAFAACGDSGSGGGGGGGGGTVGEMDPSITDAQLAVYCSHNSLNFRFDLYNYYYADAGVIYKMTTESVFENSTFAQYEYDDLRADAEDAGYYDIRKDGNKVFFSTDGEFGRIADIRAAIEAGYMNIQDQICIIAYPQS